MAQLHAPSKRYCFDRFELDPGGRVLMRDSKLVSLGARAFDLLCVLIERRERVVSKHELIDLVWGDSVVEENNLQVQISSLRKVFGPSAIATVPGRGYRFVAPLKNEPQEQIAESRLQSAGEGPLVPATAPSSLLIGREGELAELEACLQAHRIVSIVGAGGIGKTRLARSIAESTRTNHAGTGIWVDLAALTDPTLVPATLAQAMRMPIGESRPTSIAVAEALADRTALLILDNCEHLVAAASELVDALRLSAPWIRILATSQEPLHVPEEQVFRLGALSVPPPNANEPEQVLRAPAARLFCARAHAADPRFALTESNAEVVADICRQLDGIALAIELAAARVPLLGVVGVRERLRERFRVLTAGSRVALPKHKTLRGALEWSYSLLSRDEQVVLRRLGVFAGRFTLEAARDVAADNEIDGWAVLDTIGTLVDKSWVLATDESAPSFSLLETTRMFVVEQLEEAAESATMARRHAHATLSVLQELDRRAWMSNNADLYPQLLPELGNVREASNWAISPDGDYLTGVALAVASQWMWELLARRAEGLERLQMLRPSIEDAPPALRAGYWRAYTRLVSVSGLLLLPEDAATKAVDLTRAHDPSRLYEALAYQVMFSVYRGRLEEARCALVELTSMDDGSHPPRLRALRFLSEGEYRDAASDRAKARVAHEHRRSMALLANEWTVAASALTEIAYLDLVNGDLGLALERAQTSVSEASRHGNPLIGEQHQCLGIVLTAVGSMERASEVLRIALAARRGQLNQWKLLEAFAFWWAKRGDVLRAVQLVGHADKAYERSQRNFCGIIEGYLRNETFLCVEAALAPEQIARARLIGARLEEGEALALAAPS